MATCYRHPKRETGVACSSCGRPICPDCMTPTSVGMRCPECARERTPVRNARTIRPRGAGVAGSRYSMTQLLIAINVIMLVAEVATGTSLAGASYPNYGTIYQHFALDGPNISVSHQYYRLLTSGFLHDGLLHILFNMWFLYIVGPALEQAVGRWNFGAIYLATLFAGSFGALLFEPGAYTVGASGALFGLLGALIVVARYRGISIWQSGLGATLLINIVFSLSIAGISIGGHLGGLAGGLICGWLYMELVDRRRMQPAFLAGCLLVAVVSVAAALAVAGGHGLTPNGLQLF
jgi:membrane associated rhomboid family serine protease